MKKRPLRVLLSTLYLVVLVTGPILEGLLEASGEPHQSHVERTSQDVCGFTHDEAMCQICRLSQLSAPCTAPLTLDLKVSERLQAAVESHLLQYSQTWRPENPRAPPVSV